MPKEIGTTKGATPAKAGGAPGKAPSSSGVPVKASASPAAKASAAKAKSSTENVKAGPTPARRALDGPELPEPTEAEVEAEIKGLMDKAQAGDLGPAQELTLVRGRPGRGTGLARGRSWTGRAS